MKSFIPVRNFFLTQEFALAAYERGIKYELLEMWRMAEFSYKQAISLEKDNEEYYLKTAEILANQDRTDEAMLCLENGSQSIEMGGP